MNQDTKNMRLEGAQSSEDRSSLSENRVAKTGYRSTRENNKSAISSILIQYLFNYAYLFKAVQLRGP